MMATPVDAAAPSTSAGSPSSLNVPDSARRLFQSYYEKYHHRSLADSELSSVISRAHDLAMQTHPYRCIKQFRFSTPRLTLHPTYKYLISTSDPHSLYIIDVGCCMGTDIRQLVLDNIPPSHIMGIELEQQFIDIGLDVLFHDRERLQNSFCQANLLQSDFLQQSPALQKFIDSTPHGKGVNVLYSGSVYHLFSEEETHAFTRNVSHLLTDNATFFGRTLGLSESTTAKSFFRHDRLRFLHSIPSFTSMLEQYGFTDVQVHKTQVDMPEKDDETARIADTNKQDQQQEEERAANERQLVMFAFSAKKKKAAA